VHILSHIIIENNMYFIAIGRDNLVYYFLVTGREQEQKDRYEEYKVRLHRSVLFANLIALLRHS
jgi:hypothetical protein